MQRVRLATDSCSRLPSVRSAGCGLLLALAFSATLRAAPLSPAAAAGKTPVNLGPAAGNKEATYPEVEEAVAAFNAKQFPKALELFQRAAEAHGELPPARVMIARLYLATNQLAAARDALEQATVESTDDPEPYLVLGDLAFGERRLAESGLLFEKALELAVKLPKTSPRHDNLLTRCYAGRAAIAENRQQWEPARENLEAWLLLDPKAAVAHQRFGQVLFWLEKPQDAYKELQTASQLNAELPAAEVTMGRLYQQSGSGKEQKQKASEWMDKAIAKSPDDVNVQLAVAEWYFENGDLDQALEHGQKALELKPDAIEPKMTVGLLERMKKNFDGAEAQFESAYVLAPGNLAVANQLALTLAESSDAAKLKRGVQLAEVNVRQFPNNAEAAATLGWLYLKSGRVEDAGRALQAASNSGTLTADTAYYLANFLVERDKQAEAIGLLRSALESPGRFFFRDDAEKMLVALEKKAK